MTFRIIPLIGLRFYNLEQCAIKIHDDGRYAFLLVNRKKALIKVEVERTTGTIPQVSMSGVYQLAHEIQGSRTEFSYIC